MDFNTKPTSTTPEITQEIAQGVYLLIREYGSADLAFKSQSNSEYEPEHFGIVEKEYKRIDTEVNSIMWGKDSPNDEEALIALISSKLLDVSVIVPDVRIYSDGNSDKDPDFETWKATFKEKEMI